MVWLTLFLSDFCKDPMKLYLSTIIIFCLSVLNYPALKDFNFYSESQAVKHELKQQALTHLFGEVSELRLHDRPSDIKNHLAFANPSSTKNPQLFGFVKSFFSKIRTYHRIEQIFKLHCSYLC